MLRVLTLACVVASCCPAASAVAVEPLRLRIDRLIDAGYTGPKAPPADDAELLRRTYLDIVGRIPTVAEARAYLDDRSPEKRLRLVDRLLQSAEHPRRLTEAFHAMLMERRGDHDEWLRYLQASFEKNKPWDVLVREIIDPSADDAATRGAAWFAVNRLSKVGQQETDYPGLTRDVGRMFLGMDLQCAQCHDHLFIDDYKQPDFQGLYTVFLNTAIRTDVQFPALTENLMSKKIEFMSVFTKEPKQTGPRVPGMVEVSIPSFPAGDEYLVKPDKKTKVLGVPKFSPLEAVARDLTSPQNRAFRENLANRLWWLTMGRGLVEPLDQFHRGNPPTHPELLALLGDEIVARKFDLNALLRELYLSETYARGGRWTAADKPRPGSATFAAANAKPLSAEQLFHAFLTAVGPNVGDLKTDDVRKKFVAAYANPAKEPEIEFAPSVKAALFLSNDSTVLELLKPKAGNLVERLSKAASPEAAAEELYLAVLSRRPTADETADVRRLSAKYAVDRPKLFGHLAWSLLSSTEFCLNH